MIASEKEPASVARLTTPASSTLFQRTDHVIGSFEFVERRTPRNSGAFEVFSTCARFAACRRYAVPIDRGCPFQPARWREAYGGRRHAAGTVLVTGDRARNLCTGRGIAGAKESIGCRQAGEREIDAPGEQS